MENCFNAVIIGCGAISVVHATAIQNSKHAKLYGVCDTERKFCAYMHTALPSCANA